MPPSFVIPASVLTLSSTQTLSTFLIATSTTLNRVIPNPQIYTVIPVSDPVSGLSDLINNADDDDDNSNAAAINIYDPDTPGVEFVVINNHILNNVLTAALVLLDGSVE